MVLIGKKLKTMAHGFGVMDALLAYHMIIHIIYTCLVCFVVENAIRNGINNGANDE